MAFMQVDRSIVLDQRAVLVFLELFDRPEPGVKVRTLYGSSAVSPSKTFSAPSCRLASKKRCP